jgi:hypothetical protein
MTADQIKELLEAAKKAEGKKNGGIVRAIKSM